MVFCPSLSLPAPVLGHNGNRLYKGGDIFIKNVSSSTSHKKTPSLRLSVFTSIHLSLREFKKILPNTFIYGSILIKIYMNINIMNTQIFHLRSMTLKVIDGHKSSSNFSVNPTLPLMDGRLMLTSQIVCISLFFLTLHLVLYSPLFLLLSLFIPLYLPLLLHANINLHY